MKYAYMLLFAVLTLASCSVEDIVSVDDNKTEKPQEPKGYSFSVNVGDLHTRVTYHDNIGNKDNPYNPNSDGTNKLTMDWRDGDELVAIRWKKPYNEYVVLKAKVGEDVKDAHTISFSADDVAHFDTALVKGERFVLVHGDFVLDPGHGNGNDPVIDFPTSQVTKTGYANHIHHGGVVEGKDLTFRNQDGTLENLRKHEYMVADCYVHVGEADASGNVQVSLSGSKDNANEDVYMNIAHTLLRLTLFLPDKDFNNGDEDDLIAVSIKDANMKNIFHRYFRMHPSAEKPHGEKENYYKTSYNDNADHEENPYIRVNLMDEETGKRGVSHRDVNVFGSDTFNPKKPVSVAGTLGNEPGHYFTLYFSLPSRHMGVDGQAVSELYVTAFTRNHAYTTSHTYRLPDDAMVPAMVVPLNVSFVKNSTSTPVITDPELGISFTPGFVYANKNNDGTWTYGVYDNQGEYAGMSHQTLDFGEFFTFGSKDPTNAAHKVGDTYFPSTSPSEFTDVAAEVEVNGAKGLYHMLTQQEATRLMTRLQNEVNKNGVFFGYYYYNDGNDNTKHKAPGSQNDATLTAAAAGGKITKEDLKNMSASVGIYVGRSSQPKFEEQDEYFFLPNSMQMAENSNGYPAVVTDTDALGNSIYYYVPKEYRDIDFDATHNSDSLEGTFSTRFKFSTWLRDSKNSGYRMQVWTQEKNNKKLDTTNSGVKVYAPLVARPIRAVVY